MTADKLDESPGRPLWSQRQAAEACGVSRSTIQRALKAGLFPSAVMGDDGWSLSDGIPEGDLLAAGFHPGRSVPDVIAEPATVAVPVEEYARLKAQDARVAALSAHLTTALDTIADLRALAVRQLTAADPPVEHPDLGRPDISLRSE